MRRFRHPLKGGEIAGLEFGDPIREISAVFLHATGFNAMTYQSILAPLGLRARVAGLDMRGHGKTRLPLKHNYPSWRIHAMDVISWIEANAPQGVVLSGHSMGGCVALMVAGKRPDLVKGLVLADPVILRPRIYLFNHLVPFSRALSGRHSLARGAKRRRSEFANVAEARESYKARGAFTSWREPFLDDYLLDGLVQDEANNKDSSAGDPKWQLACDPAIEAATFAAQRNRPWSALSRVRKAGIPLTILKAERNSVMSSAVDQLILRRCPQAIIKTVRGTSHFLPMEAPYALRDDLSSFIARLIEGFDLGDDGPVQRTLQKTPGIITQS
ncbi:MAG: alpha/beta hydrolase [Hyphomonadaceae bacterium]